MFGLKNKISEQDFFALLEKDARQSHGRLLYVGRILQRAAQRTPQLTALISKGADLSYNDLYTQARAVSSFMHTQGVRPRDRVIICLENSFNFYRAYFGAWQIGAVVTPLNIFLQQPEVTHIVNDAKPTLIITDQTRRALFEQACTAGHNCRIVGTEELESSFAQPAEEPNFVDLDEHEMAALLYTSGTTGMPKGVMLSSHNIMMNMFQGVARLQFSHGQERIYAILPLFHSFAQLTCVWGPIFMSCAIIVVPKIDRRFILEGLQQKPTFIFGVPALYGLFCLFRNLDFSCVRYFVSGGDMLPDKIRAIFSLVYRRKLVNGYGLTETTPLISVDFDDTITTHGNVGAPCVQIDVHIRDEQANVLPRGAIGTLWIKGPNVMRGYYNAPEQTAAMIHDGWLNTGDLAYIDNSGKIVITGRAKDLIIHKGINIYPAEVENIIALHPAVMMVGVIGQPQEQVGEIPIAFVQLRAAHPNIEQELHQLCATHLAAYKIPRRFICTTDRLPATATGKIDKKALRAQLNTKNSW